MGNSFFIDKRLKKDFEKDIRKRNKIEEKINKLKKDLEKVNEDINNDLEKFYWEVDDTTVVSTLEYFEKNGDNKKKKNLVKDIESRYRNSNLLIEDTLKLADWYEEMCDYENNKI